MKKVWSSSLLTLRGLSPITLSHTMSQYASSPGSRSHCYVKLAISSPVVTKVITSTHCTEPHGWFSGPWMVDLPKVTSLSANQARCSLTLFISRTALPLRQTGHYDQSTNYWKMCMMLLLFMLCWIVSKYEKLQLSFKWCWRLRHH